MPDAFYPPFLVPVGFFIGTLLTAGASLVVPGRLLKWPLLACMGISLALGLVAFGWAVGVRMMDTGAQPTSIADALTGPDRSYNIEGVETTFRHPSQAWGLSETGLHQVSDDTWMADFSMMLQADDGRVFVVFGRSLYRAAPEGGLQLQTIEVELFREVDPPAPDA